MKLSITPILCLSILLLTGCGENVKDTSDMANPDSMDNDNSATVHVGTDGSDQVATAQNMDDVANASGINMDSSIPGGNPLNDPNSILSQRIIYFDFDSSHVTEEARAIISAHAEYLSSHPEQQVILEGHCDERGTRDYNLSLGEKRAIAVAEIMKLQGVAVEQIQVVSYGEERPIALGHDEESWKANRRVEVLYQMH